LKEELKEIIPKEIPYCSTSFIRR
jgi:DNA-directed RNA polymerase subunit RPC12/RpoP